MYYRSNRNNNNRFNRNSSHGRRGGGARRIKSFDPSTIVDRRPVSTEPEAPYVAKNSFDTFEINGILKRNIKSKGYETPTPIQDQAIPVILQGRDVIGIANTGTGKTAAFLVPILSEVAKNRDKKVLIVIPTRELAAQISTEFMEFSRGMGIYFAMCIGGTNIYRQKNDLRRNPNFVIGTPGRLKDLINQGCLNLANFNIVVLDEVDQMVDIGFINDIKYMVSLLSKQRQSLFFSATLNEKTKDVLNYFVRNPITISVKQKDLLGNIKHDVLKIIDQNVKIDRLHDLLIKKEFEKVLIFGRTKWGVQRLSDELVKRGFQAEAIHGNKSQSQRLRTLDKFKRNYIHILLATDVAARGLDINNVSHVINYDPPETYDTYIHRVGRTGRAEKTGTAITFI